MTVKTADIHYGAGRSGECGYVGNGVTLTPENVTCLTCRGWLPIVAPPRGEPWDFELLTRLEALFWRTRPTQAELDELGLSDILWPEQLKRAHRTYLIEASRRLKAEGRAEP